MKCRAHDWGALLAGLALIFHWAGGGIAVAEENKDFVVDLNRFAGDWYELARTANEFEDGEFEQDGKAFGPCYNATARYTIEEPRKLRIENICERRSEDDVVIKDDAIGVALVEEGSRGRKLKVAFGPGVARAMQRLVTGGGTNYWIYCLGPVNQNGKYDWAVVSGSDRDFLFLMSRRKTVSGAVKSKMMECARSDGLPVDRLMFTQK